MGNSNLKQIASMVGLLAQMTFWLHSHHCMALPAELAELYTPMRSAATCNAIQSCSS